MLSPEMVGLSDAPSDAAFGLSDASNGVGPALGAAPDGSGTPHSAANAAASAHAGGRSDAAGHSDELLRWIDAQLGSELLAAVSSAPFAVLLQQSLDACFAELSAELAESGVGHPATTQPTAQHSSEGHATSDSAPAAHRKAEAAPLAKLIPRINNCVAAVLASPFAGRHAPAVMPGAVANRYLLSLSWAPSLGEFCFLVYAPQAAEAPAPSALGAGWWCGGESETDRGVAGPSRQNGDGSSASQPHECAERASAGGSLWSSLTGACAIFASPPSSRSRIEAVAADLTHPLAARADDEGEHACASAEQMVSL
jgi:hypothetical protein